MQISVHWLESGEVSLSIEPQVAVAVEHVLWRVPALSTQAGGCLCSGMLRFYQADLLLSGRPQPGQPLPPFLADVPNVPGAPLPADAVPSAESQGGASNDDNDQSHTKTVTESPYL